MYKPKFIKLLLPHLFNTNSDVWEYILGTLSERERFVLEERFGLRDGEPKTLQSVSLLVKPLKRPAKGKVDDGHVDRERIRQIEAKALRKLRHPNRRKILEYSDAWTLREILEMEEKKKKEQEVREVELATETRYRELSVKFPDTIDSLDLPTRVYNALRYAGLDTIGGLLVHIKRGRLINLRNIGVKAEELVLDKLKKYQ